MVQKSVPYNMSNKKSSGAIKKTFSIKLLSRIWRIFDLLRIDVPATVAVAISIPCSIQRASLTSLGGGACAPARLLNRHQSGVAVPTFATEIG
jgi:hypothetical protein